MRWLASVLVLSLPLIAAAAPSPCHQLAPATASFPCPAGASPTSGVMVPAGNVAGDGEATAIELDPANLAFLPAWSIQYLHTELNADGVRGGRGNAIYLAAPLPYLDQLAVGFAAQSVRPPDAFPYNDLAKVSFALAWRPLPQLALGATYAHVITGSTPGVSGIDTVDLAASGRLGRWLALALVVHDLPSPQFNGLALQRVYEPELAVRPLGDGRLELAVSARIGERRGDVDPRIRISAMPYPGLHLRGSLELVRDIDGDRVLDNDLRATLGLELDFARFGGGGYAHFGSATGSGYYHGFSVTARVSGDRYPSLWRPLKLERVDLTGSGDRAHVALLAHLHRLERDPRSDGIVLVIGDLSGGWATMEELKDALTRLRAAGKHVFAYGAELTTKSYYVASAAERIYLDPAGGLRLIGMAQSAFYFKGTFDLIGVHADFVKIAEYKSAPEQYTRPGPSDEAKMVRAAVLDDLYGRLVSGLAAARRLDPARVRQLIDQGPYTAAEAKKLALVDELAHGDEVEDAIGGLLHRPVTATVRDTHPERPRSWAPQKVAVIFVEGDIVEGKSNYIPILDIRLVGHQSLIEAIEKARSDGDVKAIVLRVDSPGGSALASDLVARELQRTRRVKPVICSFGDTAASGGYFVAAYCDAIVASPSTITGSIGIFTGKFDVVGLAKILGVGLDLSRRGARADIESYFRPYSDDEKAAILEKLRYYYDRFVDTVADGRRLKHEQVDAIGRGRVWTGAQAKPIKLVDLLGGFADALDLAKQRAKLDLSERVELVALPEEPSTLLGQLARLLGIQLKAEPSLADLPAVKAAVRGLPASLIAQPGTMQARMEIELDQ